MIRIALTTAIATIASASLFLVGCVAAPNGENVDQQGGALQGAPCVASDPACDPSVPPPCKDPGSAGCAQVPPCASSDPNCGKQPPCDPAKDPSCAKVPPGGGGVDCASLAKELTGLLATAQACNIASEGAKAQCQAFVPTTSGCDAPVASADADVTLKYLEAWKPYAASCPLPVPACPDPKTLTTGCEQDASIDSLIGVCAVIPSPGVPPASN